MNYIVLYPSLLGGEWFTMWQSQTTNGQDAPFRLYMALLAVLIFVNQADSGLPVSEDRDNDTHLDSGRD